MTCNKTIDVTARTDGVGIFLGVWDTLNVKQQTFDVSAWIEAYGEGTVTVLVQRNGDAIPYEAAGVSVADGIVTWTFDETDTSVSGNGSAALLYVVGGEYKARTPAYQTYTAPTLGDVGPTPPDPWQNWYEEVLAASEAAQASATDAEASADRAEAAAAALEIPTGTSAGYMPSGYGNIVEAFCPPIDETGTITAEYYQPGTTVSVTAHIPEGLEGEQTATIYRRGKNLLPNNNVNSSGTVNGVSWVRNSDNSVTLTGTATAAGNVGVLTASGMLHAVLPYATYTLSGCPARGAGDTYRLICNVNAGATFVTDTGSGAVFVNDEAVTSTEWYVRFDAGQVFDGVTFYPMLRLSSVTDAAYERYTGSTYPVTFEADGSAQDLDPVSVPALDGVTTLWCDLGDVTAEGYESLVHVINETRGAGE